MEQDYVNPPLRRQPMAQIEGFEWTEDLLEFDRHLVQHDWHYDYADDYGIWSRGYQQRQRLRSWAALSEQHLTLWNWHCTRVYKR